MFFVSYESFRLDFADRLSDLCTDQIPDILALLDAVASGYDITRKTTDIIPADTIPQAVRLYVASKAVEHLSPGTLSLYPAPVDAVLHCRAQAS